MPLTEYQIRAIARIAKEELGAEATYQRLQDVVRRVVETLEREGPIGFKPEVSGRALIICLSADGRGNASALSRGLRETGVQISERFERTLGGFHVLMAAVEGVKSGADLESLRQKLGQAGNQEGVRILVQMQDALIRPQ